MTEISNYPALNAYLEQTKEPTNEAVKFYCDQLSSKSFLNALAERGIPGSEGGLDPEVFQESVVRPIVYSLQTRAGKRVRCFAARLFHDIPRGKKAPYRYLDDLLVIPEAAHQATLINDDIADETPERNEQPATHKKYNPKIAANAGDLLYFAAKLALYFPDFFLRPRNGSIGVGKEKRMDIIEVYDKEMLRAHAGQAHDLAWSIGKVIEGKGQLPTRRQYLEAAGAKGATMSIATTLGAILGRTNKMQRNAARASGYHIAVGFQLRDDAIELENPEVSDYGEDVKGRKVTLPMLITLTEDNAIAERLRKALSRTILTRWAKGSELDEVKGIMEECGAVKKTNDEALRHRDKAIDIMRANYRFPESRAACQVLEEFLNYTVTRTK